jgi:hypothetical protein
MSGGEEESTNVYEAKVNLETGAQVWKQGGHGGREVNKRTTTTVASPLRTSSTMKMIRSSKENKSEGPERRGWADVRGRDRAQHRIFQRGL